MGAPEPDSETSHLQSGSEVDTEHEGAATELARGRMLRRRKLTLAFSLISFAASLYCLFSVMHEPSAKEDDMSSGNLVSFASTSTQWTLDTENTGCSNWKVSAMQQPIRVNSADDCGQQCANLAGCQGFNYEKAPPDQCGGQGKVIGECYLWSDECDKESNNCWDLYKMSSPSKLRWYLRSHRTSCVNAQSEAMSQTVEYNANACGVKCMNTNGCAQFDFQPGDCQGQPQAVSKGACFLFDKECTTEPNNCMDLYHMWTQGGTFAPTSAPGPRPTLPPPPGPTAAPPAPGVPTPAPTAAAQITAVAVQGSMVLEFASDPGFKENNVIQVGSAPVVETGEIASVAAVGFGVQVTMTKELKFTYPVGTEVMFKRRAFETQASEAAAAGSQTLAVSDVKNFKVGDGISVGNNSANTTGPYQTNVIDSMSGTTMTLMFKLHYDVAAGTQVMKIDIPTPAPDVTTTAAAVSTTDAR